MPMTRTEVELVQPKYPRGNTGYRRVAADRTWFESNNARRMVHGPAR